MASVNCSCGQSKLLMAEIEFLTKVSRVYPLTQILCLYVGSAPGSHILLLTELFPTINFMLWDPLPHHPDLHKHKKYLHLVKTSIETQIKYFRKGDLLPAKEYKAQIKTAKELLIVLDSLVGMYNGLPQPPTDSLSKSETAL